MPIDAIATLCVERDAPVLFLDTCCFLDISRGPVSLKPDELRSAIRLLECSLASKPRVTLVVSSYVRGELDGKRETAELLQERFVAEAQQRIEAVGKFCRLFDLEFPLTPTGVGRQLASGLAHLRADLLSASHTVPVSEAATQRAYDRIIRAQAPCHKGDGRNDARIVEDYLCLAKTLGDRNFHQRLVFMSSNTRDFCLDGHLIHPDLAPAFEASRLEFVTNFAWADASVMLGPRVTEQARRP